MFDLKKLTLSWNLPKLEHDVPLNCHADQDKLIVVYDSNKIIAYDLNNMRLHDWSLANMNKFPSNFLNRYNRIVGITQVSFNLYLIYTNYTYIVLDLSKSIPSDVEIIQNHPGKTLEDKNLGAKSWFDTLKLSQSKFLKKKQNMSEVNEGSQESQVKNLTISNKLKGILNMEYDKENNKLLVVENIWRKLVESFPGALAIPKYGH